MKRLPETILAAHELDLERRELFVEGARDRTFFNWLLGDLRDPNAMVLSIDEVDIPDPHITVDADSYGNRDRLIEFLRLVDGEPARIMGFIDRDDGNLISADSPGNNVVLTDFRDLESYSLFEENVDRVLRAGWGSEAVAASDVLSSLFETASQFAALRLVSVRNKYKLPVGATKWERHVRARGGLVEGFVIEPVVRQLLQNADLSLSLQHSILEQIHETMSELASHEPRMCVQGKDSMRIARIQFKSLGIDVGDASHLLGSTLERDRVSRFPLLSSAAKFLERA